MSKYIYVVHEPDRHRNYTSLVKAVNALNKIVPVSIKNVKPEIKQFFCYIYMNGDYQINQERVY